MLDLTPIPTIAIDELRLRLRGGLHEPGDPAYVDACTLFNAMIERHPRLVARCCTPDDVVAALAFARDHALPIAVRAGGHSVNGASLCDDGLVLDVRGLDDIDVDPAARVVRVGAGQTWGALDRATQAHGLAVTGGRVSTTGVAGLTLGGGSGWLERAFGLTCDNLLAVELVTPDGRLVRASADENPELLWAHRGAGGEFGVVTTLELALYPLAPEVLGGLLLYPADRGPELLAAYRDATVDAPPELGLAFAYLTAPDEPPIPPELRGKPAAAIAGLYAGPIADGERAMAPLRAFGEPALDGFGPTTYVDFQCSLDDPPGYRNWWTAQHMADLDDAAIAIITERAAEMVPGPAAVFVVAWGGAVATAGPQDSPLASRDAQFVVHPLFLWEDPADDAHMMQLGRRLRDELAPHASAAVYLNFVGDEGRDRVRAAYGDEAYARLQALKATWDPERRMRGRL
jgi:FAD/FMN-containing dehydrogenase